MLIRPHEQVTGILDALVRNLLYREQEKNSMKIPKPTISKEQLNVAHSPHHEEGNTAPGRTLWVLEAAYLEMLL